MVSGSIACIDIGSSKVCAVIANVAGGRILNVLGVGDVPSQGVQKGVIVDIEDASRAIREALDLAEEAAGFKATQAYVGFTGRHIASVNTVVSVDLGGRDRMITQSDIREAERKVEAISFPEDRVTVNVIKRQYAVDNIEGIKNPLGMHGRRLDLEAHIITADMGYRENRAVCLERAGIPLSTDNLVANPRASAEAVLEPEDKERGAMVLDMGGGTTGVAIYRAGSIWYTGALPVAGRQVTKDLAMALEAPFSGAEELKLQAGTLYPEDMDDAAVKDVLQRFKTSAEEVSYVVRARVEEILRMAEAKVPQMPGVLVVTGGTAKLPGMDRFAHEVLGVQARVGLPRYLPEDPKGLDDPRYASVVGLALWGSRVTEAGIDGYGRLAQVRSGLRSAWDAVRGRLPRVSFGGTRPGESQG